MRQEQLWKMNNTMFHRGPNDGGILQFRQDAWEVGLAQRRLAIQDLSELGHQPMVSEHGRYSIVYNGEVYNFKTIKKRLQELGYVFQSECDTEVILHAYAEWKNGCFSKFNGMFAIAVYDKQEKKLLLARDRIGKKPLYYYWNEGHFVFGSELKPIMAYPYFKKMIRKEAIGDYLCNKYLAAPFCIFEHTYKMAPGTILEYKNGQVQMSTYWDVVKLYHKYEREQETDWDISIKKLDAVLQKAVTQRLVADVPVGTFLSGGIDSTVITAIAQKNSSTPMNTYSIGFYDKERNEAPFAAEISRYLGTKHHEHYVTDRDIMELIEDLPVYFDEPFSDSSQLPTMLVSKYASEDITVALSGDGGDELFCGYKMYDWTWAAQHLDQIGNLLNGIPGAVRCKEYFPPEVRAFINNRNEDTKTQLYIDVMMEEADRLLGCAGNVKFKQERKLKMHNWQIRRMLLDMQTYLPDEILAKTDRASMKYSLEVRCPLLDCRVVAQSFQIPQKYKYHLFNKKYILKQEAYRYVPKKLLDRPKKGFGVPLKKWLRTVLKNEIVRYADPLLLKRQDIFHAPAVWRLIQKQEKSDKIMYSSMLWSFYIFQKWYQKYIEDLWSST